MGVINFLPGSFYYSVTPSILMFVPVSLVGFHGFVQMGFQVTVLEYL